MVVYEAFLNWLADTACWLLGLGSHEWVYVSHGKYVCVFCGKEKNRYV